MTIYGTMLSHFAHFFYQTRSGSFTQLESVICSLWFIYSKSMLGMAPQLIEDYQQHGEYCNSFEPWHEIIALFVLRKLILQTCMRSHPVGLDVWFLVWPFVYFHTSCVQTAKALGRLHEWAGSHEPSLVAYVISIIISWAGSINICERFIFEGE